MHSHFHHIITHYVIPVVMASTIAGVALKPVSVSSRTQAPAAVHGKLPAHGPIK